MEPDPKSKISSFDVVKAVAVAASSSSSSEIVIQWEDFDQELSRFCSLSSAVQDSNLRKLSLQQRLETLLQVKAESLSRLNELDEMRENLEARKVEMQNKLMHSNVSAEETRKQEEKLSSEVRALLVAGSALSASWKRLQEAKAVLAGVTGNTRVKTLLKKLKTRQQHMISQVAFLYPVKVLIGKTKEQELESFSRVNGAGNFAESKPVIQGSLTVAGLQLSLLPFKKLSFFTDKKEVQRTATALGYVAHVVSLIASYLQVPLRYPLRLGGSRSYIDDYAPSVESTSSDILPDTILYSNPKAVEFPLFLEGQDTTRAAYAVFLLNKDLEQLLNFVGVKSLGPRHVLANLKELLATILSQEYTET